MGAVTVIRQDDGSINVVTTQGASIADATDLLHEGLATLARHRLGEPTDG